MQSDRIQFYVKGIVRATKSNKTVYMSYMMIIYAIATQSHAEQNDQITQAVRATQEYSVRALVKRNQSILASSL